MTKDDTDTGGESGTESNDESTTQGEGSSGGQGGQGQAPSGGQGAQGGQPTQGQQPRGGQGQAPGGGQGGQPTQGQQPRGDQRAQGGQQGPGGQQGHGGQYQQGGQAGYQQQGHRPNTQSGLEPNVAGAACYALAWLSGLFFFFTEKEDDFIRFHAAQSIVAFGILTATYIVVYMLFSMIIGTLFFSGGFALIQLIGLFNMLLGLVGFALWLGMMFMAYQGRRFELPIAGSIANDLITNNSQRVDRQPQQPR